MPETKGLSHPQSFYVKKPFNAFKQNEKNK